MRKLFIFVVFAAVLLSNYARSGYVATTYSNKDCDFSNWYGRIPKYDHTCVRMYYSGLAWWKSSYPWCYHADGTWDYCKTYSWEYEITQQNHLVKSESRKKEYYFSYDYTETTYEEARKICRRKGDGWDVASFQAKPSYELDYTGMTRFARRGLTYNKSVENIQRALSPVVETWDAFWVRNVENSEKCLDYYKYRSGGKSCNKHTGICVSDNSLFKEARCDQEKSFVCERDLL